MNIVIQHTDLHEVVESVHNKEVGFSRLKTYKPGTTKPWLQLERIGLSSKSINCDYTGQITLYIQRGGILNIREIGKLPIIMEQELSVIPDKIRFKYPKNKYFVKDLNEIIDLPKIKKARELEAFKKSSSCAREINTLFNTELLPSIKMFAPDCSDSFVLNLHYSNRRLVKIDLEYSGINK